MTEFIDRETKKHTEKDNSLLYIQNSCETFVDFQFEFYESCFLS